MTAGRLWFVEVLVWILVALAAAVLAAGSGPAGTPVARSLSPPSFLAVGWHCATTSSAAPGPRRVVHDAGVLVLRRSGWAAAKASTTRQRVARHGRAHRRPARLLRQHAPRSVGARRTRVADLAARDSLPRRVDRRRGRARRGVAVHLPDPLPGVSRCSTAIIRCRVSSRRSPWVCSLTYLVTVLRKRLRERRRRAVSSTTAPALR